jgi:hypothetical protein
MLLRLGRYMAHGMGTVLETVTALMRLDDDSGYWTWDNGDRIQW